MNSITLRDYQKRITDEICKKSSEFLSKFDGKDFKKIIFRAPTGSGKTVMMQSIIERLVLENNESLSFVWISKGILAEQSKKSFEKNIGGGGIKMSFLEDILDNEIKENEILFVNWEKIFSKAGKDNSDKNIKKGDPLNKFMRDNEWDRTLESFCRNARHDARKIVLIIDESHLNITPNTIKIIEEIIKPALQIDVTATPKDRHYNYGDRDGEFIELQEVKDAEVIKKEVVINIDIKKKDLESEKGGDRIIFEKALEKRKELLGLYKKEGSKVRPLVLIQLPNEGEKMSTLDTKKRDWVEKFLKDMSINYTNGRLAKWFSGNEKENKEGIEKNDSKVDFLIFKQAIAVGWDCPRAQILVKFRETRNETFEIQTVGRIMRMPEFKHHKREDLNRAYVYANLLEISIDESALEYIKTKRAVRKNIYKNLDLLSAYITRSEYNDLTYNYRKYFFNEFISEIDGEMDISKSKQNFFKLKKKIGFNVRNIKEGIIVDKKIDNIDKKQKIKAGKLKTKLTDEDIEMYFIALLKNNCSPFQQARSFGLIKTAIYQTFDKYLNFENNFSKDRLDWQKLVVKNKDFFVEVITNSISKYDKNRKKKQKEEKLNIAWNIPKEDFYPKNTKDQKKKYKKCIMDPCFVSENWKTETGFIKNYLEENNNVEWWYKNGDAQNEIYFAIKYVEKKKARGFYPDFIVKYKDGRIGIFDTKQGSTAKSGETILKSNELQKYFKKENKKGKKLFGGIVVPKDKRMSIWKINEDSNYNYEKGNWKVLGKKK